MYPRLMSFQYCLSQSLSKHVGHYEDVVTPVMTLDVTVAAVAPPHIIKVHGQYRDSVRAFNADTEYGQVQ